MKKKTKYRGRGRVLSRIFACQAAAIGIEVARQQAMRSRDKELCESLARVMTLLDHEMQTFLDLPVGVA